MPKNCSAILLALALFLLLPTTVAAAECQFVLGFNTLRNPIGPDIVGECPENEHHGANGDSLQQTTGGLLVWRKADNWTAFTDGHRSWINGPFGLEQRFNVELLPWEAEGAIVRLPWVQDGISHDERQLMLSHYGILGWYTSTQQDVALALQIVNVPFMNTYEANDIVAMRALRGVHRSDDASHLRQVLSHPKLQGGIRDNQTALFQGFPSELQDALNKLNTFP